MSNKIDLCRGSKNNTTKVLLSQISTKKSPKKTLQNHTVRPVFSEKSALILAISSKTSGKTFLACSISYKSSAFISFFEEIILDKQNNFIAKASIEQGQIYNRQGEPYPLA